MLIICKAMNLKLDIKFIQQVSESERKYYSDSDN